jgi:uncharacterized protein (DUF427 family)
MRERRPVRAAPSGPGQESAWDYPRPPRVEPVPQRVRVIIDRQVVADTVRAVRVLETASPPVYYVPREDVAMDRLVRNARSSTCEWKGRASYWTWQGSAGRRIEDVAWSYEDPSPGYGAIRGCLAFYAGRVDEAWVGEERARPQPGGFYGGWITSWVTGPFKGEPGTFGW